MGKWKSLIAEHISFVIEGAEFLKTLMAEVSDCSIRVDMVGSKYTATTIINNGETDLNYD